MTVLTVSPYRLLCVLTGSVRDASLRMLPASAVFVSIMSMTYAVSLYLPI